MPDWIIKYWVNWLFGIICGGFIALFAFMKNKFAKQKALENGMKALLHDKLFQESKIYIERGWVSFEELDNLSYVYNAYHELHGNSTGTTAFEEVSKLPKTNKGEEND